MISGQVEAVMVCNDIHERLGAFFDAEVPRDEEARIRDHIAVCTACSAELDDLRMLSTSLAPEVEIAVPEELWPSIERRLHTKGTQVGRARPFWHRFPLGVRFATAAAIVLVAGAIGFGLFSWDRPASASEINFAALLDALPLDVDAAFRRFVEQYNGERSTAEEARRFASALNFAIPSELPGGFRLKDVFILRIGSQPGVAARYDRQGEFLAAVFHPPVQKEDFGSHKDYECVVGQHRGHAVSVDGWTMVHVTDPTTCHCVLSRLRQSELPPILRAVAPDLDQAASHVHEGGKSHP